MIRSSTLWAIGDFVRHLKGRLMPPGGDMATAVEPDDREAFYPGQQGSIRTHWLGYRPSPRRLRDARPEGPGELSPTGACWYWNPERRYWALIYPSALDPDDLWLSHQAIADPGNLP